MAKVTALDQTWLRDLVGRIVQRYRPLRVVLFGSYARGDYSAFSDLDLLLVLAQAPDWYKRGLEFRRFLQEEPVPIEAHIYTSEEYERMKKLENPFLLQIESEGKVLYEQQ